MGSVNVNRSLTDQFYRYKMPKLIAKVEGKGNGIKTVIVNMVDVAKALNRPPTYPTKFFGCELGAQTQFDIKNERFIVNGSHEASKLQDLLDGFIKRYVLCLSCENPETVLSVNTKKGVINSKCKACGTFSQVDITHKLATYIIKNPPDQDSSGGASVQSSKKNRRKGKDEKSKKQNGEEENNSPQNESDNSQGDNTNKDNGANESLEDDDDWAMDTDAHSVALRMAHLSTGAKGLMLDNDLDKSINERLNIFFDYLNKLINKQNGDKSESNLDPACFKDLYNEAERLEIKEKATLILCELLLNENILQQTKHYRSLLLKFTFKCHKAQKYLLGGIEQIIKIHNQALMPRVSLILESFYDKDILEEEVILEWASKVSKKYVSKEVAQEIHERAIPFIKWLKEASEEESSEEEETVEVVYSDSVRGSSLQEVKEPLKKSTSSSPVDDAEADDDLDIDAI